MMFRELITVLERLAYPDDADLDLAYQELEAIEERVQQLETKVAALCELSWPPELKEDSDAGTETD